MKNEPIAVIGAGPAGLSAAYELIKQGKRPVVFEKTSRIGGIARTEVYKGYYFDIGGHRFYTKIHEVQQLWLKMLGKEFLKVPRISHIYYQGRFFPYPLEFVKTITELGMCQSFQALLSYCRAKLFPCEEEKTVEQWLSNRFGRYLYEAFFESYTEKVWGLTCRQMPADWVIQRIKGLSFISALSNSLVGNHKVKTLIPEFYYPREGPGMMWQQLFEAIIAGGGQINLDSEVSQYNRKGSHIISINYQQFGKNFEMPVGNVISSAPITRLVAQIDPIVPEPVLEASNRLSYRSIVVVILIVNKKDVFPGQWIYIHEPNVRVGRIQNFKNWSLGMVPDVNKTSLGMEFFCSEGDDIWNMNDREMTDLALREFSAMGFGAMDDVSDMKVVRQPKAYPVYDLEYETNLRVIRDFLKTFSNIQSIGRNGMHRYNNMDHSMYTGMLAARNIFNGKYDLWSVNDENYFEERKLEKK
jgi:protoporphyrinogen oxidase